MFEISTGLLPLELKEENILGLVQDCDKTCGINLTFSKECDEDVKDLVMQLTCVHQTCRLSDAKKMQKHKIFEKFGLSTKKKQHAGNKAEENCEMGKKSRKEL